MSKEQVSHDRFSFFQGAKDVLASKPDESLDWDKSALRVRESISDAMNAKHLSFLLGSGCSSLLVDGKQLGIATMAPLAEEFLGAVTGPDAHRFPSEFERTTLATHLGLDIDSAEFRANLERLMEVLYSFQFALTRSTNARLVSAKSTIDTLIAKIRVFITDKCANGPFSNGDASVISLYQRFYRKLAGRDRALPRPWVFTTNYDLLNEIALDRLGIPYCNGFSGTIERRFNPTNYRYALAEQLDLTSRKWVAVDNFIYLCKLHGSINWVEEGDSLFPIRERLTFSDDKVGRVMIYPTPMKQNVSFGSPYSDLFREFQGRIAQEQSVLVVVGYSFGDQHINNLIFQALTVPTFRLVALVSPDASGDVQKLRELGDPRVWIVGGAGPKRRTKAHYFSTFVDELMPESPSDKVDAAIKRVLQTLMVKQAKHLTEGVSDNAH